MDKYKSISELQTCRMCGADLEKRPSWWERTVDKIIDRDRQGFMYITLALSLLMGSICVAGHFWGRKGYDEVSDTGYSTLELMADQDAQIKRVLSYALRDDVITDEEFSILAYIYHNNNNGSRLKARLVDDERQTVPGQEEALQTDPAASGSPGLPPDDGSDRERDQP